MSKRLTDEELQAIRERVEKATEAPWGVDVPIEVCSECEYEYEIVESSVFLAPIVAESKRGEDAAFIAHARQDIPKLLAEIDRLRNAISWGVSCGECTKQLAEDWEITEGGRFLCRECIEYGGDNE